MPLLLDAAEPPSTDAAPDKPLTTLKGELGDLLRAWHAEGTAAGHAGIRYDNRDRGHSELDRRPWPQLGKVAYTDAQKAKRFDWAFCGGLHTGIVFGNSSTSAQARVGGSNARMAYTNPRGLAVLLAQYTRNHLYVYPEHQDHDPGHNGNGGWGDLFPTNTPFVIVSQGSSGSDRPFLRALAATLAAFRPGVREKLVKTGTLMPTVQMIFRSCNRHLKDPADYRTGRAHPTVFEGGWVDALAMAKMAHEIEIDAMPPVAMLKVLEEDAPVDGLDYFEPGATEKHFDSPFVIARVFRGRHRVHRMVVSAAGSGDLNKRPLTTHWAVLRGDASRIRIAKRNNAGTVVEIAVPWHARRPVAESSRLESNRVDIGCFVHNGRYDSPPAFVTFYFLDHESRAYDATGRLLEIGYRMGETRPEIANWDGLASLLGEPAAPWPVRLFRDSFPAGELDTLRKAMAERPPLVQAVREAEARKQAADEARKRSQTDGTDAEARVARKALDTARKNLKDFSAKPREELSGSIDALVVGRTLGGWLRDPAFYVDRQSALERFLASPDGKPRRSALEAARKRAVAIGVLKKTVAGPYALSLLREEPTRYERAMLERFHGEILAKVLFPGVVRADFRVNHVPPELSEPPGWRDVYRYAPGGERTGWTRYALNGDPPVDFTADGLRVLERDARGRPTKAQTMTYRPEEPTGKVPRPHWRPLLQLPGDAIRHYAYVGEDDRKGRVTKTEKP